MSLRNLQRRMAKLEKGAKPKLSRIVIWYGSFDAFAEKTHAAIAEGKLCHEDMMVIVGVLRKWDCDGTWYRNEIA